MEPPEKKIKIDAKNENNEEPASLLTYDVLRIIFKHLCAYDLYNATRVCRSWNEAASKEAITRRSPEIDHYEKDHGVSHVIKYPGKKLNIISSLGLIFLKLDDEDCLPQNCWCDNLPSNCKSIVLGGYDIVDNKCGSMHRSGTGVGVFLPKTANINCKIFSLCDSDNISYDKSDYENLVEQILPSKDGESKCIIILTNEQGYEFSRSLTKVLQRRYKPGSLSLWGGINLGMKLCGESEWCDKPSELETPSNRHTKNACWMAITLSGSSLQSWSLVLPPKCRSQTQIEEKLQKFKEGISLKKYSMGLMFACCERLWMRDTEIALFKKVFPNVSLYGLHGDGEIGLNTLNNSRESQLHHAYSTIFLILTYQ